MLNPFKRSENPVFEEKRAFTVYSNNWKAVAPANSFTVNRPQVLLLSQQLQNKTKKIPVYILKLKKGYRILDMERGGDYEWKVTAGMLMIGRRLTPGPKSRPLNEVKLNCCPN